MSTVQAQTGKSHFLIGDRLVGVGHPCYIIAELSCNHGQRYEDAVALIRAAAAAGADAVKLQTYTPDTLTIDSDKPHFLVDSPGAPESWQKISLYKLYQTAFTPWEWHAPLQSIAREEGIDFFSTPFDETAVQYLENLAVPCHKIASYEATYTQLLRSVAATGKPIILSVGFATLSEIDEAVRVLRSAGCNDIALLHCVTTYSEQPEPADMRLSTIKFLADTFGVVSGFSDNNGGSEFPALAVMAGASIVEKHLTLSKNSDSHDARFSLDEHAFARMVEQIREAESTLGHPTFGTASSAEEQFRKYRRSVFAVRDVKSGEKFTKENLRVIRPAHGLPPNALEEILGKVASKNVEAGTPLSWDMIDKAADKR